MSKRRTRGDGGLYQRHDHESCPPLVNGERAAHKCQGRWCGTVEVIEGGRRRRKYVYGRTQVEARRKLNAANRAKEEGTLVVASLTVTQWMNHWLDHIAARKLRPQTLRGYRSKIDRYIVPHVGRYRLPALTPDHVRLMYDDMREQGLSEATLRQTHAILARALKVAVRERKLGRSPLDAVDPPTTHTERRAQLTVEQARTVLRSTDDPRWWLALFYGMRQGEVLGLRWCDVDLDRGVLRITQSLQTDLDGQLVFGPPKSRSSQRPVPLLPQAQARLRLAFIEADVAPDSEQLVFHDGEGGPVPPKKDWEAWRDLLAAAGLPHVALHSARNTATSMQEAAGVPDRLTAQIVGHAQVTMTHRYQDAELERVTQAFTAVGRLLELE